MRSNKSKRIAIWVVIVAILGIGAIMLLDAGKRAPVTNPATAVASSSPVHTVIGRSVQGRAIDAYAYGDGPKHLLFVGGIHGGYEWNSVLLAYSFMDYIEANPDTIPAGMTVTVIPDANPDAVFMATGKEGRFDPADVSTSSAVLARARFNADNVDLNRNFDCKWQPKGTWQNKIVSGGSSAFSEPEAQVVRDFALAYKPAAAVFWHSQSNAVYASQCKEGILPKTLAIMNAYAKASGYPAVKTFDAYPTTGAADDWLASVNIPAITVELSTHENIEWNRNLAGIKALIAYVSSE